MLLHPLCSINILNRLSLSVKLGKQIYIHNSVSACTVGMQCVHQARFSLFTSQSVSESHPSSVGSPPLGDCMPESAGEVVGRELIQSKHCTSWLHSLALHLIIRYIRIISTVTLIVTVATMGYIRTGLAIQFPYVSTTPSYVVSVPSLIKCRT